MRYSSKSEAILWATLLQALIACTAAAVVDGSDASRKHLLLKRKRSGLLGDAGHLSKGEIIVIVLVAVVLLLFGGCSCMCFSSRKQEDKQSESATDYDSQPSYPQRRR